MLLGTASPMRSTALGRHVLKTHQLDEQQHMGKYIAPGKNTRPRTLPFRCGIIMVNRQGAAMVELQSHHQNKGPTLDGEYRLVANERAEFIGLQRASNGETRIATSLEDGIAMATKHPQSGILVSIHGTPAPLTLIA